MKLYLFFCAMGLLGGSLLTEYAINTHLDNEWYSIVEEIEQCQQELPRNETCKIIAIPDEGGGE